MLYAGLDVHKEFVQAAWVNSKNQVVREERFATDPEGLRGLCEATRKTRCVVESSTSCFQVYDALQDSGVRVRVAHPLRVKAIASAKVKTDKVDAITLAQLERANLIPEAHIPSKATRELRLLVRQHVALTKQSTRLKNGVRSLFLKQGVKTPANLFDSRKRASEYAGRLTGSSALSAKQLVDQLRFVKQQRSQVDEVIEQAAKKNEDAVLLKTIPGVGWFSALALASEIDGVQRFPDAERLQSYAGLVPSVRQSGNVSRTGRISKQGNSLMRWVLVQDAWIAVRNSKRFRKLFVRVGRRHGHKRAIVAVARKMLRCAFFMLSRKQAFDENA